MSNYTPIVAYGPKDALSPGDPNKVILGTQQDAELQAISAAIATKYDSSSGVPLLSSDNTWTGTNSYTGAVNVSTPDSTTPLTVQGGGGPNTLRLLNATAQSGAELNVPTGISQGLVIGADAGPILLQAASASAKLQLVAGPAYQAVGPISGSFVDMTPDKSSFTGTFTGFSGGSPTATVLWSRQGNQVTLLFTGGQGTSNSGVFLMTGLPSSLQTTSSKIVAVPSYAFSNSSALVPASSPGVVAASFSGASGTISFLLNNGISWANTGTKGIVSNFEMTYSLL